MGMTLAKALQYCTAFASNDDIKLSFGYGYIDGDKAYASDTHACIECQLDGDKGQQSMPLSKSAIKQAQENPNVEYSTPQFTRALAIAKEGAGEFTLSCGAGLKPLLRLWKDTFSYCKKLAKKGKYPATVIEASEKGLYAYIANADGMGAKFMLCDDENMRGFAGDMHGNFNAEYLIKVCNVLIDMDPTDVTFRFGDKANWLLVQTESARCLVMGMMAQAMTEPLMIFYNQEKCHG